MVNVLILDKEEYRKNHNQYIHLMNEKLNGKNSIVYTSYEDDKIRKIRNYRIVGSALQHILYWKKSYDYAKEINKSYCDVIYCLNPIVGIFLGLLNKHKKHRIILCGFLFEPKENQFYYRIRTMITRKAISGIDKIVVYGSREVEYYKRLFPENDFLFVKYGIDFDNIEEYTGKTLPDRYLFSGGGSNRDYYTLTNAYKKYLKEAGEDKLVIATQPWRLEKCDVNNIIVLQDVVNETFGDVLKKAKCLVLSLKDSEISAGHMVMFQAMSLGVPVIVNDISAIRDYVDERHVTFYTTGNINELVKCLQDIDTADEILKAKARDSYAIYSKELGFINFINRVLSL